MARRRASAGDRDAVAACTYERYAYAKAAEQRGGGQACRDHEPLRHHRTGSGLQSPAAGPSRERAQLAAFVDFDSVGLQALRQAGGELFRAHEAVDARMQTGYDPGPVERGLERGQRPSVELVDRSSLGRTQAGWTCIEGPSSGCASWASPIFRTTSALGLLAFARARVA